MESGEDSPGAVAFEVEGKAYRLDAIKEKGEPKLFMIFADNTSGKETYPAGRYLYVDPPDAAGQNDHRLQQGLQPALCFHEIRDLPAATAAESPAFCDRSGRKVQQTLAVSRNLSPTACCLNVPFSKSLATRFRFIPLWLERIFTTESWHRGPTEHGPHAHKMLLGLPAGFVKSCKFYRKLRTPTPCRCAAARYIMRQIQRRGVPQ